MREKIIEEIRIIKRIRNYIKPVNSTLLIISISLCNPSYGDTKLEYSPNLRLNASIGKASPNRIGFTDETIEEVIGNEDEFEIKADKNNQYVYLTPKVEGEINISVLTSKGNTQDLSLKVTEGKPATVIIESEEKTETDSLEVPSSKSLSNNSFEPPFSAQNINGSINEGAVLSQVIRSLYNTKTSNKTLRTIKIQNKPLSVIYHKGHARYQTIIASYKNTSPEDISLEEAEFTLPGTIAVSLEDSKLVPNTSTRIFMVVKK